VTVPRTADTLLGAARAHAAVGAWGEVRALLEARRDDVRAVPEAALLLGEALLRTGQLREARAWLVESLDAVRRSTDRAALRRAVNLLGAAHFELGELDEAERAFAEALDLGRRDGDDVLVARATNNLGLIANVRGEHVHALTNYELAIPAYQRLGNVRGLAESYHNMAITYRDAGRLERADECEQRAVEFARAAASPRLVAMARTGRADISLQRGDARLAEAGARRAARDFAEVADPVGEANALRVVGVASLALERADDARAALDRAVALAREHGSALIEAEALRARAELEARTGADEAARRDAAAAAAIFERLGMRREAEELREQG
jgi:tetratricopeptide (TPR) repeat protein